MRISDWSSDVCSSDLLDPVGDEAAFAWSRVLQFLRERGAAAAAAAVTHDNDFGDFQHLDGEFKRCRDAVASGSRFEWRHQRSNVAHYENLTRIGVEDERGIDSAIRTCDDQNAGTLSVPQFVPALALLCPTMFPKTPVARQHVVEICQDRKRTRLN